jgi:hypothetical protein
MKITIKAFHPMTMGVMYHCGIVKKHDDNTSTVRFYGGDNGKYRIPNNHISIDGELQENVLTD